MAYPAGYFSEHDDDEVGGFLSDDSYDLDGAPEVVANNQEENEPIKLSLSERKQKFFRAILRGNIQETLNLLDASETNVEFDINLELSDGWNALILAASIGNVDLVRELIERKADVNFHRDKFYVLMAACNCPSSTASPSICSEIVNILIAHGVDVNAKTRTRKTAFMYASSNGNVEIVQKLLNCCDINAEDNQGWNALFWAVHNNKPEVLKVLLEAGFDLKKIDVRGKSVADYALELEYEDIIESFPEKNEDSVSVIQESYYTINGLFSQERPHFYRDICCLLYGMKCDQLINTFRKMDLLNFLVLDNKRLIRLGIVPYQRNRILTGLYKFHKQRYKPSAIPFIPMDSLQSTSDIAHILLSIIRQFIAMQASIQYISNSNTTENLQRAHFHVIKERLNKIQKTSVALSFLVETWDSKLRSVDLVTIASFRAKNKLFKWFTYCSLLSLTSLLVFKAKNICLN